MLFRLLPVVFLVAFPAAAADPGPWATYRGNPAMIADLAGLAAGGWAYLYPHQGSTDQPTVVI